MSREWLQRFCDERNASAPADIREYLAEANERVIENTVAEVMLTLLDAMTRPEPTQRVH